MFKFPGPWTSPRENLKNNFLVCPWYDSYPRTSENLLICVSQKSVEWTLHPKTNLKRQSAHEKILMSLEMRACQVASVASDSLQPYGLQPVRLLCPWDSPGKNTGVGCPAFPQGIFLTDPGIERVSLTSPAMVGGFFLPLAPPGKPHNQLWGNTKLKSQCDIFIHAPKWLILKKLTIPCIREDLEYLEFSFMAVSQKKGSPK